MTRARVIAEIKRLAAESGGKAPGRQRFESATGIRVADWYPHLWLRWGDALAEAGLGANELARKTEDEVILKKYASLVRELGRVPLNAELKLKAKRDRTFPSHSVFGRFGGKAGLIAAVKQYCESQPACSDVLALLPAVSPAIAQSSVTAKPPKVVVGYVYLMKSGRHYKIGRSNSVGRREWELGIKIPLPPTTVHSIETDDPIGVEAYWHRRFEDKRGEGEWFNLTSEDIAAFKRWRKIA
jgi:hypothetical protein